MKTDLNLLATTSGPGARNDRTQNALNGLLPDPVFDWIWTSASTTSLQIGSRDTGFGDTEFRIPWRQVSGGAANGTRFYSVPDTWTLTISGTGISGTTGQKVDGVSLTASRDLLVWAFFEPASDDGDPFIGIALTSRPWLTAVDVDSGGGLGASTVFGTASGAGWRFPIGCRILAREGTGAGADYNQGVVTAHTTDTVTATMDAAYSVTNETNTAVAGTGTIELQQISKFAPRMHGSDSLYPGSGVEYSYCYLGMIQIDSTSTIYNARRRGEFYQIPGTFVNFTTAAASAGANFSVARMIPIGSEWAEFTIQQIVGGAPTTASSAFLGHPNTTGAVLQTDSAILTPYQSFANGLISVYPRTNAVRYIHTIGTGATSTLNVAMRGYYERNW